MPTTRKRRTRSSSTKSSDVVAPGGGTQSDVNSLAENLGLDSKAVHAILNCEGSGIVAGGNVGGGNSASAAGASAWADFMEDEGFGGSDSKKAKTADSSKPAAAPKTTSEPQDKNTTKAASVVNNDESAVREYNLPLTPLMRLVPASKKKGKSEDKDSKRYITPGLLAQTGTLDSTVPGRNKRSLDFDYDLQEPTLLTHSSVFNKVPIGFIAASSSSCHSIAITVNGDAYAWGRNDMGQCGNGETSSCVPLPTKVDLPGPFVGGAVGKSHSILIHESGDCYAAGSNKYGQCGVNSSMESVLKWRKCVIGSKSDGDADETAIKIVEASCGEQFSVLLTSSGHIYSCGLSEFGQLGNGETGEYFISANKLAFANANKFERRWEFVVSSADSPTDDSKKESMLPLPDSADIRIGSISCGKNHTIAVEATSQSCPRVFSWGCGDYGCLGHGIQADQYTPRLVSTISGPMFQSNAPVKAAAGSQCSMVQTQNGHVYYWGKHRSVGEATMRPSLIDSLANNGHVVAALGGGFQTVFCGTANGVTVSWGNGSNGELGFGKGQQKSSAKPKFVEKLDKCLVTNIACGYGHTLFLIRDEDEEDKSAWANMAKIEAEDLEKFVSDMSTR